MDVCNTRFGSRQLHYRLSHPSLDRKEIELSHSMVGTMIEQNRFQRIRTMITHTIDGERVARRFETAWKIHPGLIGSLYRFLETWESIDAYCKTSVPGAESPITSSQWTDLLHHFKSTLIIEALFENRASRWEVPIRPDSNLIQEMDSNERKWETRIDYLKSIMEIKGDKSIKLCSNDSDGYTI